MQTSTIFRFPPETSDEKLADMASGGHNQAFCLLVERHTGYVTRIVSRFLFKEEETKDTVQDVFVRLWKNLDKYDGRSLFTTWLYSIAFNLCIDRMRINRRRKEISLNEEYAGRQESGIDQTDPVNEIDHVSIGRAVRRYAGMLSRLQRQVFVLRDLHDLPVDEVCRLTGLERDQVKANLYHARKFLREKLINGGYL